MNTEGSLSKTQLRDKKIVCIRKREGDTIFRRRIIKQNFLSAMNIKQTVADID